MNNQSLFTKKDAVCLKGLAILLIAFHNFFHLLPPNYACNEFRFIYTAGRFAFSSLNFSNSIIVLFSFLGYVGIYVFFFLSGYGLTKQTNIHKSDYCYSIKRIWKLWKLLLLGVVWYIIINIGHVDYLVLLRKLTMTDNFSIFRVSTVSMPWWFLCCLAQLYLIFIPLYKFIHKKQSNIFIILYLYVMIAYLWQESAFSGKYIKYMYWNFIGHLPEFCLGIFLAEYENKLTYLRKKSILWNLFIFGLLLFLLAQFSKWVWVFNGVATILFLLSLYKIIGEKMLNKLSYLGMISPYFYIIHGFTFRYFFVQLAKYDSPLYQILWALVWFLIVSLIASLFYVINNRLAHRHCKAKQEKS